MSSSLPEFTVTEHEYAEDQHTFHMSGESYVADQVQTWYEGPDGAPYQLEIKLWDSQEIAETVAGTGFSVKSIVRDDESYSMDTGLNARIGQITVDVSTTDDGQPTHVETIYDSVACVERSHIVEERGSNTTSAPDQIMAALSKR